MKTTALTLFILSSVSILPAYAQEGSAMPGASTQAAPAVSLPSSNAITLLRRFVHDVKSAKADFVQTVRSPNSPKVRRSSGSLEFIRPNRFRFDYTEPYEQSIVGDGQKVWIYEADLNQITVRPMNQALGASPAALLSAGDLDRDFTLLALPEQSDHLQWVQATPRSKDGQFQSIKIGFLGSALSRLDVTDSFGQISSLEFRHFETNPSISAERFKFTPPPGADVINP